MMAMNAVQVSDFTWSTNKLVELLKLWVWMTDMLASNTLQPKLSLLSRI
jgi:hypothetical protein